MAVIDKHLHPSLRSRHFSPFSFALEEGGDLDGFKIVCTNIKIMSTYRKRVDILRFTKVIFSYLC